METVTIGQRTLEVKKEFSGIQTIVDEIIVLCSLLGYKVNTRGQSRFQEPILFIFDKEGHNLLFIEFGLSWRGSAELRDIDVIIYEEHLYTEFEEDRVFCLQLKPFKEYWERIKLLL